MSLFKKKKYLFTLLIGVFLVGCSFQPAWVAKNQKAEILWERVDFIEAKTSNKNVFEGSKSIMGVEPGPGRRSTGGGRWLPAAPRRTRPSAFRTARQPPYFKKYAVSTKRSAAVFPLGYFSSNNIATTCAQN